MDAVFIRELMIEEGTQLFAYDDANGQPIVPGYTVVGHVTIGIGRALDIKGISAAEAVWLLDNDLASINMALRIYPWWTKLSSVRQFVIVDMAFNLGITGLLAFRRMIAALQAGNYTAAATEMLASSWAKQLPDRSQHLATIMRTGVLTPGG